ncbi:glycosyltransferase [Bifidobacterium subtile]|jgi:glycosyltransferase involved in cell wall biosynthesis|nr:glycosyltransferase [Bifidobacterium subtile]QOL36721.1 glycosyltransferase [Bifidobacterium subtile]
MMKKILFVMSQLYNGGAERSLVNLFNELPRDRYDIDLLLFRPQGMFIDQVPDYVNILPTPHKLLQRYSQKGESGYSEWTRLIPNIVSMLAAKGNTDKRRGFRWRHFYSHAIDALPEHYDVAVAYLSGEQLAYVDEKVDADRKYVWVHNDYIAAGYAAEYDRPHFANMNAIISISQHCVDVLKQVFPEYADKIRLLENITSSKLIRNRSKEFIPDEIDTGKSVLLTVGRFDEQKGVDLAIRAASLLQRQDFDFTWYLIGGGSKQEGALKNLIAELNVQDCFRLLGTRANPYPYIANCDVFVQPSRFEGKSMVLDEAKILAKPIVVTDYPTVHDQIHDNREGMVVAIDPESIAEGIGTLLRHPETRNVMASYLSNNDYGNADIISEYCRLFDGKSAQ